MKNIGYLITGYMLVWGGLFLFLLRIWILNRKLSERVAALETNGGTTAGTGESYHE